MEKVILTNMCMIYNGTKVVVQKRICDDWLGIAFPGGHMEKTNLLPTLLFVKSLKKQDFLFLFQSCAE